MNTIVPSLVLNRTEALYKTIKNCPTYIMALYCLKVCAKISWIHIALLRMIFWQQFCVHRFVNMYIGLE